MCVCEREREREIALKHTHTRYVNISGGWNGWEEGWRK